LATAVRYVKDSSKQFCYSEQGVETVEYLGLASVVVVLVGAVALYLSGAGQVLIDAIRDLIAAIIAGFARGW
jgi:hypothetical protein